MKPIVWLGATLKTIRSFSSEVRAEIGYNLDRVQRGQEPYDCKSMPSIGMGVKEIRIHGEKECRIIYIAKYEEAIYVLHSFIKKTQKTSHKDLVLATNHYAEVMKLRRKS